MGTGKALLWTASALVLPGAAHLRAGRRLAGSLILVLYLLLVLTGAVLAYVLLIHGADDVMTGLLRLALQDQLLLTVMAVVFTVAVLWLAVILHSWTVVRPTRTRLSLRLLSGAVVLVLCAAVAAPASAALYGAYTTYDTLTSVFGPQDRDQGPHDEADPWVGAERVSVLLLGSDGADGRYGVRTDSMMVASVDTASGDTVLIGLPRNLQDVQFPEDSALAERYPQPWGFDLLLNDLYQTVAEDPGELALNPYADDPAADTLKEVVAFNIGLPVDYYAMVDMRGFRDLIDAVGGVRVRIEEPIPYGREGGVLEPGLQRLTGYEALWYSRSRINTDDYGRMGRQGCLVKYVAEQIEPTTVLTSFRELAGATKRTLTTDIPQSKVSAFMALADQVTSHGEMHALQLSPPQVNTANPDWDQVKALVEAALDRASGLDDALAAGTPPADPPGAESSGEQDAQDGQQQDERTEWQRYTGLPEPSPADPGRQVGEEPTNLDELCP